MSSDSYTLKELVQEVRADNKQALSTQSSILTTLENIDKHLAQLNSKVAAHESKMIYIDQMKKDVGHLKNKSDEFTTFQTKVMMVWSIATFIIVTALNKFI